VAVFWNFGFDQIRQQSKLSTHSNSQQFASIDESFYMDEFPNTEALFVTKCKSHVGRECLSFTSCLEAIVVKQISLTFYRHLATKKRQMLALAVVALEKIAPSYAAGRFEIDLLKDQHSGKMLGRRPFQPFVLADIDFDW